MKHIAAILLIALGFSANAQEVRTYTTNEGDSMACIQNLSLYIEFYKQDNFKDAIKGWRNAIKICPKSRLSLYINGANIIEDFIDKAPNAEVKAKYIDTLMWVYDQRIVHFQDEGNVLARKGMAYAKYKPKDDKGAYEILKRAYELSGNELNPNAVIYLFKSLYDITKKDKSRTEELFELYDNLSEVVAHNIKAGNSAANYEVAQSNLDKMVSNVAECPDLVELYGPKLKANPKDEKVLRQIIKFFEKKDCTDEDIYQQAAVNLYAIEPSATAAYAIANGYAKQKDYAKAKEYFVNAADQAEDDEMKVKALTKAANTSLLLRQYSSAKSFAQKLLAINASNGEAYIIIGNAYVGGRKDCGGNECTSRAAYWAAADKYLQAMSVDPSVSSDANSRLAEARAQFPKKEDCFFHSVNDGDPYTIECWIGETTKVRVRD